MDAWDSPAFATGPVASLRSLGATLLAIVGNRVDLAWVELREEGERRRELLVLAAAGVTLLYLGIAAAAVTRMRRAARVNPAPFAATLAELERDRQMLRGLHG